MTTTAKFYSLQEAAQKAGVTYDQLWYAVMTGKIPEPERVGRTRLFTDDDILVIQRHFQRRSDGTAIRETPGPESV